MKMTNLVRKAEVAARRKDYQTAFELLQTADKKGDPEASYAIGTWYLFGRFVDKDLRKAASYFSKASKKGYKDAVFNLALCYEVGAGVQKDLTKAFSYYYDAFTYGEQSAAYEVGRMLYYGIGVPKNRKLAEHFILLSEDQKAHKIFSSIKREVTRPRRQASAQVA